MVRDVGSFHASGSFRFFTSVLHFREMQEGAATPWPDHFSFQPRADGGLSAAQDRPGMSVPWLPSLPSWKKGWHYCRQGSLSTRGVDWF